MNIYRNIKDNVKYQLKHVTSASDLLLVTLQCTKMRLSNSNSPVTLKHHLMVTQVASGKIKGRNTELLPSSK